MTESVIYLDNNASTQIDPRVLDAMMPFLTSAYANPSSKTHNLGRIAANAVERARANVAALTGADPLEIVFTGGATESNNLAILGLAGIAPNNRKRIVTSRIEHKSVLGPVDELKRRGFSVSKLDVDRRGRVDLDQLEVFLSADDSFLVSVQAANSEIGTRQDILTISRLAHQHGAIVHCDAVQAMGKVPVDVVEWGVDLLSLNAHKLYGPKGVGALYLSGGARAWPLQPLMYGGNQEHGLRPGTLDTPAIMGFGTAAAIAAQELQREATTIGTLRDGFEKTLLQLLPDISINGDTGFRIPGTTSVTLLGVDSEALLAGIQQVAASTTSACNSGTLEPSHVLLALGLTREEAYQTVRFAFGRFSASEEADRAAKALAENASALRRTSRRQTRLPNP